MNFMLALMCCLFPLLLTLLVAGAVGLIFFRPQLKAFFDLIRLLFRVMRRLPDITPALCHAADLFDNIGGWVAVSGGLLQDAGTILTSADSLITNLSVTIPQPSGTLSTQPLSRFVGISNPFGLPEPLVLTGASFSVTEHSVRLFPNLTTGQTVLGQAAEKVTHTGEALGKGGPQPDQVDQPIPPRETTVATDFLTTAEALRALAEILTLKEPPC